MTDSRFVPASPKSEGAELIASICAEHGLYYQERMTGGHAGTLLAIALDEGGETKVIKTALGPDSVSEVEGNIVGYDSIVAIGGAALVPTGMQSGEINGSPYLVMPHLGVDIRRKMQADKNGDDISTLVARVEETVEATLLESPDAHSEGLGEYVSRLSQLHERLGVDGPKIDVESLCGPKACLMLMDFTPDNVFINGDKVTFIDPWKQHTYLGSFVPSIGQFTTLAADIYKMPLTEVEKAGLGNSAFTIGEKLGLSEGQISRQFLLGRSLQYALSGFVRVDTEPVIAQEYIARSQSALHEISEGVSRNG